MPNYYVTAPKLERTWGVGYEPVEFTVQATIYAQEGSWFVIPMPLNPATPQTIDVNNDGAVDTAMKTLRQQRRRVIVALTTEFE
jgi:hypothetical protein